MIKRKKRKDIQALRSRTRRKSSLGIRSVRKSPFSVRNLFGKVSLCAFGKEIKEQVKKASLTIEAAFALPLFFFGMVTMIHFMDVYRIQTEHLSKLCQSAKEAGMYAYVVGGDGVEEITLPDVYKYKPIGATRRAEQHNVRRTVRGQCVGDKVRQQTVEQRDIPRRGQHVQPVGLHRHGKGQRVLRGLLLQNTAKFPQLPQQVDGLRHTGAVQQRRRGGIRRLVPQPPQADQLRLQFLEQRHQLGALCRVYRVLQAVLQYLKGVLHAVKRAPEPPAQSPAQGQQCCILVPSVHGKRLLS